MKALILAAGYGTRLYPLITDTPKSLLMIAEKPLINYLLDKIRDIRDLKEVLVVTNQKFYEKFLSWAGDNASFPAPLTVINDGTTTPDDRLGSVGDIQFALKYGKVRDDVLVIGGDNLFDYRLEPMVNFARPKSPSVTIGLYDIREIKDAGKFGVVEVNKQGKILNFEEKPRQPKSSLVAMCSYYFPAASLDLIGQYLEETHKPDKAGDYIRWLVDKHTVYGYQFDGQWYDIGSLEAYREAQEQFKKKGRELQ